MKYRPVQFPNKTLLMWIAAGYGVYVLIAIVMTILLLGSSMVLVGLGLMAWANQQAAAYAVVTGVVVSTCIGVLQAAVLRRYLRWTADGWVKASALGGLVAMLVLSVFSTTSPASVLEYSIFMMVFITIVSLFQWWRLRVALRYASLWVVVNIVAALAFTYSVHSISTLSLDGLEVLMVLVPPLLQSALTGAGIIILFERFGYPTRIEDKRIPVPRDPSRPPSVWDDAI